MTIRIFTNSILIQKELIDAFDTDLANYSLAEQRIWRAKPVAGNKKSWTALLAD